jgi:hypothetical protein
MQTTARELTERDPSLSVGMLSTDLLHFGDQLGVRDELELR